MKVTREFLSFTLLRKCCVSRAIGRRKNMSRLVQPNLAQRKVGFPNLLGEHDLLQVLACLAWCSLIFLVIPDLIS